MQSEGWKPSRMHAFDTIIEMYKDFGQMTTMHGIKRSSHSETAWLKLLWTLFVFTGVAWATYQIVTTVQSYYSFPSSTQLSIETNHTLELPAVTICNLNRLRVSKTAFLQPQFDAWDKEDLSIPQQMRKLSVTLNDYPRGIKQGLGHLMIDMIQRCTIDSIDCYPTNFKLDMFINNGNCYTFGDKTAKPSATWYVKKAGPANGLILELDIEQDEYLPITQSAGIKVLLHTGTEIIFPDNSGILAAPGFVTSIGIKKSEIYMLPHPYGNCISADDATNEIKNLYQQLGYTYTKDACLRTCLQKQIFESCRCIDLDLATMVRVLNYNDWLDLDNTKSVEFCNKTMAKCMDKVQENFENHALGCEEICLPACIQNLFQTTVSTAVWPADRHLDRYIEFVTNTAAKKNTVYNWTSNPHEHMRKNFLRLEIYYETLRYDVISTSPTFDWHNLLGNIGGQLGLWLGFSVLTAIEVCQFTMQVLIHIFKTHYKSFRQSKTKDPCNNTIDIPLPSR